MPPEIPSRHRRIDPRPRRRPGLHPRPDFGLHHPGPVHGLPAGGSTRIALSRRHHAPARRRSAIGRAEPVLALPSADDGAVSRAKGPPIVHLRVGLGGDSGVPLCQILSDGRALMGLTWSSCWSRCNRSLWKRAWQRWQASTACGASWNGNGSRSRSGRGPRRKSIGRIGNTEPCSKGGEIDFCASEDPSHCLSKKRNDRVNGNLAMLFVAAYG